MKREFLEGLELDKENIDTIMAEYGKVTQGLREEKDTLKTQLDSANDEIKSYKDMDIDSIKKSASDWETKYNDLVKEQNDAKEKSIREERTNAFFNDIKFASESAKAGVIAQFNAKDFKYDEESKKFLGASEWLKDLQEKDSGAFLSNVANPKFTTSPNVPNNSSSMDEVLKVMGLSAEKEK